MSLSAAWQRRHSGPSAGELEQARLRLVILCLVTVYVCWRNSRDGFAGEDAIFDLAVVAGWLILAMGIFASIWMWPAANVARQMLGIFVDVGALTSGLFGMGAGGATLVGAYLFLIFGNGFRYGRAYLHVSQFLSLIGFVAVMLTVPWWQNEIVVAMGWMLSLVVLPSYIGSVAARMTEARVRTEEALKNCVERQRSES